MQPKDFLNEAIKTVDQRGTDNGYDAGQERSAAKVAQVYNSLTGQTVTEADVWTMLICLKLVRNRRRFKPDNIVDLAGYAGLLGECLAAEAGPVAKHNPLKVVLDHMDHMSPADLDTLRDVLREPDGEVTPSILGAITFTHLRRQIEIATGEALDALGMRLVMTRRLRGAARSGAHTACAAISESDAEFRDRLLECLRQTEDAHQVASCDHSSYEQLGPNSRRCCDCNAHFEGKIDFEE